MQSKRLKKNRTLSSYHIIRFISVLFVTYGFHLNTSVFAQATASVNVNTIKIGEELRYQIEVKGDTTQLIVFPDKSTFTPLEVLESNEIDTVKKNNSLQFIKEYVLTQFDSGSYTIPRQKVLINEKSFFTDSIQVEVNNVLVDTSKQKLYGIKPFIDVDAPKVIKWKKWIGWIGIPLFIIALLIYFLFRKKKTKALKESELPPYEKAMLALKRIDESTLLQQDSHKEYYSRLGDTARKYIDEEIYDQAMESTTDELIDALNSKISSGMLFLDNTTVESLKKVLKTADMAKFAKSKPDIGIAKSDRNTIENVLKETKAAIPEPTEEELLADEAYRKQLVQKKKEQKIFWVSFATVGIIAFTLGSFIMSKGYYYVKDSIFGHPTKELAEIDWISSSYGTPPVNISTPKVLIRNNLKLTEEQKQILKNNETFVYGSLVGSFHVALTTVKYNQKVQVDLNKSIEGNVNYFEQQGAKNITVKHEAYKTLRNIEGVKAFGSMSIANPITKQMKSNEYLILNFAEEEGYQQITIVYDTNDRYAKGIAERILNSVELGNVN